MANQRIIFREKCKEKNEEKSRMRLNSAKSLLKPRKRNILLAKSIRCVAVKEKLKMSYDNFSGWRKELPICLFDICTPRNGLEPTTVDHSLTHKPVSHRLPDYQTSLILKDAKRKMI